MSARIRPGWPMLTRVLAVLLAAVLAVQFANFAFLQIVPLPGPPVFSAAEVATVLRSGVVPADRFRVSERGVPPFAQPGRPERIAEQIAGDLHVAAGDVRVFFTDPPMFFLRPPRHERDDRMAAARDAMLVGEFVAAVRRPDGRWFAVEPIRSGLSAWRIRLLLSLIVALLTIVPFAWLLARWVTRPVKMFADAAERIGRDPRTPPLPVKGPAEIAEAAKTMNEMQDRLNRYVDNRTVMIGAIAHDLRTPLMRIGLRLEQAPAEMRAGIERDVAEMQAMIAAATDYVRGATRVGTRRKLDLRALAESVVDDYADRGGAVTLMPGEPLVLDGDATALKSVVDNLVGNALRYAGDAEVTVRREGDTAVLEVRDHGPGAVPEDLERLFEPFFRGERSRNRDTGGIGLGLASVRGTAHLHGGDAAVTNHPEGGLLARVTLPV